MRSPTCALITTAFCIFMAACYTFATSVYGQQYSGSGIEKDIDVRYQDLNFLVKTVADSQIDTITVTPELYSIAVRIVPTPEISSLTMTIPRELLDATDDQGRDDDFVILANQRPILYEEVEKNDNTRTLRMNVPANTTEVVVVGSSVIPEFPLTALSITMGTLMFFIVSLRFSQKKLGRNN